MTDAALNQGRMPQDDDGISLLSLGSLFLRWRRTIVGLAVCGTALGLAVGLTSKRVYVSSATFVPQGSEGGASGLALAAGQFGIRIPSSGGAWGPLVYVELLGSQALLEPLALDTVVVSEQGGRRIAVMDLFGVMAPTIARRTDLAVRALRGVVKASEERKLGAVRLSVTTRWPSVSLALAERLVGGVNQFNLETRKSQAVAERRFVENQSVEAERSLREAEDRLQGFLQSNRAIADSPELEFRRDRLQREVVLRQQVYSSLLQGREEARIREVRDTPVITVLEGPRLPVIGEARKSAKKGVVGGLAGVVLGVLVAFLSQGLAGARRAPSQEAQEFFRLLQEALPRMARRLWR